MSTLNNSAFLIFIFFSLTAPSAVASNTAWTTSGNIGIGTTTPLSKLQVVGDVLVNAPADGQSLKLYGRSTDSFSQLAFYNTSGTALTGLFQSMGDTTIAWANGPTITERMRISPAGNVGIGTSVPIRTLHVASTNSSEFVIEATDGLADYKKWNFFVAGSSGQKKSLFLRILNDAGAASTIDSMIWTPDGNVGIGTTNPTQKLSVNGIIRAKEIIVETTGWSDNILEKGHRLEPLKETERAIAETGHLPGIPSAASVIKDGITLGEMQRMLLAKIEELTLHQIEQERRINEQAQEIVKLRANRKP